MGTIKNRNISIKRIFVTVGSTHFDKLIEAILRPDLLDSIGFNEILIQYGKGGKNPKEFVQERFEYLEIKSENQKRWRVEVESKPIIKFFQFYKPETFNEIVKGTDLVVTHGGAGTLLDLIRFCPINTYVVAVANNQLLNDHQVELTTKLSKADFRFINLSLNGPHLLTATALQDLPNRNRLIMPSPKKAQFYKELQVLSGLSLL